MNADLARIYDVIQSECSVLPHGSDDEMMLSGGALARFKMEYATDWGILWVGQRACAAGWG